MSPNAMPPTARPLSASTVLALTGFFVAAYLGASMLDLWTTRLALLRPEAAEGNPFAVSAGRYSAGQAWIYTAIVGVILIAYVAVGAARLHRVADAWLRAPLRSYARFGSWIGLSTLLGVYFVPRMDRAPLHLLSAALAFVVLRLLAALNNAMIAVSGDGFLAAALRPFIATIGPIGAFIVVICGLYFALILATSKVLAPLIAAWRRRTATV